MRKIPDTARIRRKTTATVMSLWRLRPQNRTSSQPLERSHFLFARNRPETEPPHVYVVVELTQEAKMRRLVFVVALLAVATAGISASFAAVRHAKTLTFSERFAPALELMAQR